jgi:hypothetical protein
VTLIRETWRWLTWRRWAWAIGASVALWISVPVFNANITYGTGVVWRVANLPWYVGIGCTFLVSIALVEIRAAPYVPPLIAYLGAALVASVLSLAALGSFHDYVYRYPVRIEDGRRSAPFPDHLRTTASRNNAVFGRGFDTSIYGVIGTLIYGYLRRSRHAEEMLAQAERARAVSRQRLTAARLAAAHAAVDPAAVIERLAQIEAIYETDGARGDTLMDELIVQLREAIPKLHGPTTPVQNDTDGAPR